MTMPTTAALMRSHPNGTLPEEMADNELAAAVATLRRDLPGNPIGYLMQVAPESSRCECCRAVHLRVDDPYLDPETRRSLHRLLATPFGDLVREHLRRTDGYDNVRFGWSGLEDHVPTFCDTVERLDVRMADVNDANEIDQADLVAVVDAIAVDLPEVMAMVGEAITRRDQLAVPPEPGEDGQARWLKLIDQLMFVFSTPLRKYVVGWADRVHGVRIGAINCCMAMVGEADGSDGDTAWQRARMMTQVEQQISPHC